MTQEQFNQMMEEYLGQRSEEPVSSWAAKTWEKAVKKGMFDGSKPQVGLTRQEAAAVLDRLGMLE